MWNVELAPKAYKQVKKLNDDIKDRLVLLMGEIQYEGPVRGNWPNFAKLGKNEYHCHIKKGRPTYVACWTVEDKKIKLVEITYVGTHEKAPY